jgi:hypothetical protein
VTKRRVLGRLSQCCMALLVGWSPRIDEDTHLISHSNVAFESFSPSSCDPILIFSRICHLLGKRHLNQLAAEWWKTDPPPASSDHAADGCLKDPDPTLDISAATPQLPFVFALASYRLSGPIYVDDRLNAAFWLYSQDDESHVVFREVLGREQQISSL